MWLLALLALLTCPQPVVGAALQHRATIMGTAGETPLSPPARGKAPGSGHRLLCFPSQLPAALDTFFLFFRGRVSPGIWGFAQVLTEKGLQCMTRLCMSFTMPVQRQRELMGLKPDQQRYRLAFPYGKPDLKSRGPN